MSAIVQLSYNINEKLCLDDRKFPGFEAHNSELQNHSTTSSTSFSKSDFSEQWPAATSVCTSSSVAISTSEARLVAAPGSNAGQSFAKFDHQRLLSIHRCDIPPITLPKTSSKSKDVSETTVYKLCDSNSQKKVFPFKQPDKVQFNKSSSDFNVRCSFNAQEQLSEGFPSIVGRGCTLHPTKDQSVPNISSSTFGDVPPIKKHCRSVSELDESAVPSAVSPWKPVAPSRLWVPIQRLHNKSFSPCSGRFSNDCSKSLDYSSLRSRETCFGNSHLTPPASPVPRPASVTVIKQESGSWTFLSSQKVLPEHERSTRFSPLASPLSRFHDVSSRSSSHSGLAATKRSLSFSADFEHRKSIEYTPASTPELNKRLDHESKRSGLSRCQSHPSGLNIKRGRYRRRSRLSSNRPTLDFAKMKQTAMSKHVLMDERCSSSKRTDFSDMSRILSITPVFPSIVTTDNSLKNNKLKPFGPIRSASPVSFTIGCNKAVTDIEHRIPSPTDEVEHEPDDELGAIERGQVDESLAFVPECLDLNVDDIENETEDCS